VSPSAPLSIPDLREALAEVSALRDDVRRLAARIDAFEVRGAPSVDLDRVLSLRETAAAIGKSVVTLRHWVGDAVAFDRYHLGVLLKKDPTGHWTSSPRLIAQWRRVALRELQEVCR
jgi:hypothetical protein